MALLPRSPGALALALPLLLLPALAASRVPMPGGLVDRSVADPDVRKAAAFAVEAYNRASNSLFYYKVLRILDAKSQVVAGVKYYLTVELVSTQCEKKGGSVLNQAEVDLCAVAPTNEQQKRTCEFQVVSRPWENVLELEKMSCRAASA
ncbi:Cystatin [Varanus komodoensis]|uniref:cystatin-like isoform X2 n=1 Tax=Varanus komodoensis TaxID=61221 RepID=UPI001CF79207|nr:cystatin-like isoform X2 [Varanus komodoensis]KAF7238404.1 Cystatin [Varanus komodoensis]